MLLLIFAVTTLVVPVFVSAAITQLPTFEFSKGGIRGGSYYDATAGGPRSVAGGFSATCSATPSSPKVGESVLWFTAINGGSGNYQYFWNGTDGLTGNTSSVRHSYTSAGTKYAAVTVVSNGQSIAVNCESPISVVHAGNSNLANRNTGGLGISCYAAEESIAPGESGTWLSVISGLSASGETTYSWAGTDNLSGDGPMAFNNYESKGRKFAFLTVTSGGQKAVAACTNQISVATRPASAVRSTATVPSAATVVEALPPIQGECSLLDNEVEVGEEAVWEVVAIGGTGAYSYTWQGDEDLTGSASSTIKIYESTGEKQATVTVTSGDESTLITCSTNLNVTPFSGGGLLAGVGSYVLGNPFYLILAAILAAVIGIYFAMRKRRQEEADDEDDEKTG